MPLNLSWDERTLSEGRWFRSTIGPLHLLVLNRGDEWRTVAGADETLAGLPGEGDLSQLPEGLDWTRWSCEQNDERVQLRPGFPDLPIIARPRKPLVIAPSSSALFYVGIPATVEVRAVARGAMQTLASYPVQRLSKSWHGNRSTGNLCYALRTRARRRYEAGDWPAHDIVCAIDLKNRRPSDFPFESLYLDTGHLAIFEQEGRLWANASRVNIAEDEDEDDRVDVTYAPRPLEPAAQARELTAPARGHTRRSKILSAFSSFTDVLR